MAEDRALEFHIRIDTGTTHFQLAASSDLAAWQTLLQAAQADIDVADLGAGNSYTVDGVNAPADDANNTAHAFSQAPQWYRWRLKAGTDYSPWSPAEVVPSVEDFLDAIKRLVRDPSLGGAAAYFSDLTYRDHLRSAVEAYEARRPLRRARTYSLTAGGREYSLPEDWDGELSRIDRVEYPADQDPRRWIHPDRIDVERALEKWRFLSVTPAAAETARLFYFTRHAKDGSSVTTADFGSVARWAAGSVAQTIQAMQSAFGDVRIGADFASVDPRIRSWGELARQWMAASEREWSASTGSVRTHLRYFDEHGRFRWTGA